MFFTCFCFIVFLVSFFFLFLLSFWCSLSFSRSCTFVLGFGGSIYRARLLLLLHIFEKAFEISQWYCCDDKCVHGNNSRLFMENGIFHFVNEKCICTRWALLLLLASAAYYELILLGSWCRAVCFSCTWIYLRVLYRWHISNLSEFSDFVYFIFFLW